MRGTSTTESLFRPAALVAAFQCETWVGDVVAGLLRHVPDVLVVDDGSDDRTSELAREAGVALAEGKLQFESEAATRTLGGKRLHVGLKWSLLPNHEGRLTRVLLSEIDLTARRSDEVALRSSRDQDPR